MKINRIGELMIQLKRRGEVMKTATDLFDEYYKKPLNQRINNSVHNYIFDHKQSEINILEKQVISQGQRFNDQYQKLKDVEFKNEKLQNKIDEVLKACNNLSTDSIREHCAEYDKGWKDCAISIYNQLKGS